MQLVINPASFQSPTPTVKTGPVCSVAPALTLTGHLNASAHPTTSTHSVKLASVASTQNTMPLEFKLYVPKAVSPLLTSHAQVDIIVYTCMCTPVNKFLLFVYTMCTCHVRTRIVHVRYAFVLYLNM